MPRPRAIVESTLGLQKKSGLYRTRPACVDLDGNYCIIRSFLQLDEEKRPALAARVTAAIERSFDAVASVLLEGDLAAIYPNLHGPPGALVALVECAKLPTFSRQGAVASWRHVLDRVAWL